MYIVSGVRCNCGTCHSLEIVIDVMILFVQYVRMCLCSMKQYKSIVESYITNIQVVHTIYLVRLYMSSQDVHTMMPSQDVHPYDA